MGTSIKYFEKILLALYLIILGFLVGFDRSAAGLEVFNFRVGEILRNKTTQSWFEKAVLIAFLFMGVRLVGVGLF